MKNRMTGRRCKDYVGVACVTGVCPIANYRYFMDEGMFDIAEDYKDSDCDNCIFHHGCEDCALFNTEYCKNNN